MQPHTHQALLRSLTLIALAAWISACGSTDGQDGLDAGSGDDTGGISGTPGDAPAGEDAATAPDALSDAVSDQDAAAKADGGAGGQDAGQAAADVPAVDDGGAAVGDGGAAVDDGGAPAGDGGALDGAGGGSDAGASPAPGCCKVDGECKGGQVCFFGPFKAGKCMGTKGLPEGKCWTKAQCDEGSVCIGASACGCDAACKAMDKPGTCVKPTETKPCVVGVGASGSTCGADAYCKLPAGCSGKGVCTVKPLACPEVYKPVCGCDGKTYGNACMAEVAGQNAKADGKCGVTGCCKVDADCGKGFVCAGAAGGKGVCKKALAGNLCWNDAQCVAGKCVGAIVCPCGANCFVADSPGTCSGGGGGSCKVGDNTTCKGGYCSGPCGGEGKCAPKPDACIMLFDPVCGCDGKTYGNACSAASAGVSVKSKGACSQPPKGCCKVDGQCDKGQVCFFGPFMAGKCMTTTNLPKGKCWTDAQCDGGLVCDGAMACGCDAACKAMDKPGTCVKPVNKCATVKCGSPAPCTTVACDPATGKCVSKPIPGCNLGKKCSLGLGAPTIDCGADGFCKLPAGSKCVGFGVCALKPKACTKEYKPVCGCDTKTYSNLCMAHSAGQNAKSDGACVKDGCCKNDVACGKGNVCVNASSGNGVCKSVMGLGKGQCWTDAQCGGGTSCKGVSACPCKAMCIKADTPGTCQ